MAAAAAAAAAAVLAVVDAYVVAARTGKPRGGRANAATGARDDDDARHAAYFIALNAFRTSRRSGLVNLNSPCAVRSAPL